MCGTTNIASANFCENCGTDIRAMPREAEAGDIHSSETVVVRSEDLKKAIAALGAQSHAVAFKTDIGYSHHVNQDAGGAWSWMRSDGSPMSLIAVADGVSAGRHSEGASRLAIEIIYRRMEALFQDPDKGVNALLPALIEASREANHQVAQRPHHSLSSADATTLVTAFCIGAQGAGVWCGDSRVYRFTPGEVVRLTRDHSWAEGVVSHGLMSAEDAARDPRAHMITRWLGPPDQDDPGLETFRFRLAAGDVVLCCTDGLYMYFSPPVSDEEEMQRILWAHQGDLQAGLDELVDTALQRGGRDNITVAAIQAVAVEDVPEPEVVDMPARSTSAVDQTIRLPTMLMRDAEAEE